jgi:hypothetical protein
MNPQNRVKPSYLAILIAIAGNGFWYVLLRRMLTVAHMNAESCCILLTDMMASVALTMTVAQCCFLNAGW